MTERISREEAIAFVRAMQEAANAHDLSRMADFYVEDAVAISPVLGELRGRDAVVGSWEALFTKFPDCAIDISDIFTDGERIVFLGIVSATDTNGWFGLPPTGSRIRYRETMLCTMRDGRIAREDRIYETATVVERLEKARLDRELQIAAEVQGALLPRKAIVGERWEAAGDSIPSRAIGGDFFEFVELASGELAVALGDVEGIGTPAALVAAMLHGMFVADARTGLGPAAILDRMSHQLATRDPGVRDLASRGRGTRFATLFCGVLAPDGRFVYSNAGHVAPVRLAADGVDRLAEGGPVLGAFAHAEYREGERRLRSGDTLILFSDGVTEAAGAAEEEFGETRLLACGKAGAGLAPAEMLDRILASVRDFTGDASPPDDVTAAVIRFR